MKTIILGASSLIGSHIYAALDSRGHRVVGTKYSSSSTELQHLDLTQPGDLEKLLKRESPDIIINSVGVVGKEACERQADLAVRLNRVVVEELVAFCNEHNRKLVHLSSVAIHDGKKVGRYTETDEPIALANNLYNLTKGAAEATARSTKDHLILRMGDTFGHAFNQPERMGGSIFKWAYDNLKAGGEVKAFTGLRSNQTSLSDIAVAVEYLIEKQHQGILNIGGDEIEVGDFFRRMKTTFNLPGTISQRDPPQNYQANKVLDLTKMYQMGVTMHVIQDGLNELVPHYRIA